MPAKQALPKKTRMPPVPPRMPKNPVVNNYRARTRPPLRTNAVCEGGPWHAKRLSVLANEPTMVFNLGAHRGRYAPSGTTKSVPGVHFTLTPSIYLWEAV